MAPFYFASIVRVNSVQPTEVKIFPPVRPRAPGLRTILFKCHNTTFLADYPPKRLNPENGSLFYMVSPDALADIDNWLIGLEYHVKFKHILW